MLRQFAFISFLTLFVGCRLVLIVPEGGSVSSESGAYRCRPGMRCEIDIVDFFFDEIFVATPDYRHEFYHWRKAERHFCSRQPGTCPLNTSAFEGYPILETILRSDEEFYLRPIFLEKGDFEDRSASRCFNPLLYKKGTMTALETKTSVRGLLSYDVSKRITRVVDGRVSFDGRPATKITSEGITKTIMYIPSIDPFVGQQTDVIRGETYLEVDLNSRIVTKIGSRDRSETKVGSLPVLFAGKAFREELFVPGVQTRFRIAAGNSYYSNSILGVRSETRAGNGGGYEVEEFQASIDDEIVYRGIEKLTVPAGTFRACRFEKHSVRNFEDSDLISISSDKVIEWYGVGNGILLKSISSSPNIKVTTRLVEGAINGVPVLSI